MPSLDFGAFRLYISIKKRPMKLKTIITASLLLASTLAFGQTKLIYFKSHSGNMKHFKTALISDLFDTGNSNFGMAPQREVKFARLDTLLFLTDSSAIMFTNNYCSTGYGNSNSQWKAGKDTVFDHPLFTRANTLDSISR